jgi:hypothetical protein
VLCFFGIHKWNIIHINEHGRLPFTKARQDDGYVLLECRYCPHRTITYDVVTYVKAIIQKNLFLEELQLTRFVMVEKNSVFTTKIQALALKRMKSIAVIDCISKELDDL